MKRARSFKPQTPMRVERRTVELPPQGGRVAIVSDTHSTPHPNTLDLLRAEDPVVILHGGDIGDLSVLDTLATVAPVIAVRGNIDGREMTPPDVIELVLKRDRVTLRVLLTHIAVRGPVLKADARRRAQKFMADVVVCGHSHVPLIARDGPFVVFNPGSVGPRRFRLPIVFGVMDVAEDGVSFRHMNCETGKRWRPAL